MNYSAEKVREALSKCSLLEVSLEIIEAGSSGVVETLHQYEPISMQILLEEASSRMDRKFESQQQFIDAILQKEVSLDEDITIVLRHIINIKKIEERFHGK